MSKATQRCGKGHFKPEDAHWCCSASCSSRDVQGEQGGSHKNKGLSSSVYFVLYRYLHSNVLLSMGPFRVKTGARIKQNAAEVQKQLSETPGQCKMGLFPFTPCPSPLEGFQKGNGESTQECKRSQLHLKHQNQIKGFSKASNSQLWSGYYETRCFYCIGVYKLMLQTCPFSVGR